MFVPRHFSLEDRRAAQKLIHGYGWALLATVGEDGLRATHLPCLLDHEPDGREELVIVGHTARADPQSRDLIDGRDTLLVFQGPHGYISPSWYPPAPAVPTWNYVAVHVHGSPEVLPGEEGFEVLLRTIEHFEAAFDQPWWPDGDSMAYARRIAPGTVAFRLRATGVEAKAKLSQNKDRETREGVIDALGRPGPHHHPALAEEMRRALEGRAA